MEEVCPAEILSGDAERLGPKLKELLPDLRPVEMGPRLRELLLLQPLNPLRRLHFRELPSRPAQPEAQECPASLQAP